MFGGSMVALVTPMRQDGALDLPAFATLLDLHLRNGTAGIVVGGTTGESPTLTPEELELLVREARRAVGGGPWTSFGPLVTPLRSTPTATSAQNGTSWRLSE